MTIKLNIDGNIITPKFIRFSDGGTNVNIGNVKPKRGVHYMVSPKSDVSKLLWEILLIQSAIRNMFTPSEYITADVRYSIHLAYLPHARADRVFNEGDGFPLEAFLNAIKDIFDEIVIEDAHNIDAVLRVSPEMAEKVCEVPQHTLFFTRMGTSFVGPSTLFVAPDKGALKKVQKLVDVVVANNIDNSGYISATKVRDLSDGQIKSIELEGQENVKGKNCVIVDDICDGGGTFIPLAKMLKESGASSVTLFVSHGIFSKGLAIFRPYIDYIHCYNHISTYINHVDLMSYNRGEEVK